MTYTTSVVGSSNKMNNVNKDLMIQEPVESIASLAMKSNNGLT